MISKNGTDISNKCYVIKFIVSLSFIVSFWFFRAVRVILTRSRMLICMRNGPSIIMMSRPFARNWFSLLFMWARSCLRKVGDRLVCLYRDRADSVICLIICWEFILAFWSEY